MDCHFCEAIHVIGPYVLVVFFTLFINKLVRSHQEQIAKFHTRVVDAFERIHNDLVAKDKFDGKDPAADK